MGTEEGLPRQIREEDINVLLPMYCEGFEAGPKAAPMSLEDALSSSGSLSNLSPFAAACVTACLLGRIASHDEKSRRDNDSFGEFLKRHKALENLLERLTSTLADILEMSRQSVDPRHVFVGVCLYTSRIALYRVAIQKTEIFRKSDIDENFCKFHQCVPAAGQMSQMFFGLRMMNMSWFPLFTTYCLLVAERALRTLTDNKSPKIQDLVRARQTLEDHTTLSCPLDRLRKLNSKLSTMFMPKHTNSSMAPQQSLQSFDGNYDIPMLQDTPNFLNPAAFPFQPHQSPVDIPILSSMQPVTMLAHQWNQSMLTSPMSSEETLPGSDNGNLHSHLANLPVVPGTGHPFLGNQSG
ncbi:hypothetical protein BC567DRAFT_236379 [Phyllosticta citribraziliensis]